MDLSALLQAMTQQAGLPESPQLFAPTMPFQQQTPPPMPPMPQAMPQGPDPGAEAYPAPPSVPMGPDPGAEAAHGPAQPQGHDWKAQLPMLMAALAGLAGAGNNPFGAAGYLRGFHDTQQDQAAAAQHQAEQAAIAERLKREDDYRRQQSDLARTDRLSALEETKKEHRASFISDVLKTASTFEDPEQAAAYLKSMESLGREYGVNTSALPIVPNPAAAQRTQKGINDAFSSLIKQHGNEIYTPGWGEGVSMDVNGKAMSGADILRRQTVLSRENGAVSAPMPDTGGGSEGSARAAAYRAWRNGPGKGQWPDDAQQQRINLQLMAAEARARHIKDDPNALTMNARMDATMAAIVPGSPLFKMAQDVAYGSITVQQLTRLLSRNTDPLLKLAIVYKAGELNENFNPAKFEMGFKFASNPATQRAVASVDNVMPNLQRVIDLSDSIGRADEPTINKLLQEGKFQLGAKKIPNFRTLQKALGDELGIALGAGTMSNMKLQLGLDLVNQDLSPENFFSTVKEIQGVLINRKKSWLDQMGVYGTPELNPGANMDFAPLTSTTQKPTNQIVTSGPFEAGQVRKMKDGSIVKLLRKAQDGTWDTQPVGP